MHSMQRRLFYVDLQELRCYLRHCDMSTIWRTISYTSLSWRMHFCGFLFQVSLPNQIEAAGGSSAPQTPNSLLQSPPMHPALRRIAGLYGATGRRNNVDLQQSPTGPSAAERFSSPAPGSAKRRLFEKPPGGAGGAQSPTSSSSASSTCGGLDISAEVAAGNKVMQVRSDGKMFGGNSC